MTLAHQVSWETSVELLAGAQTSAGAIPASTVHEIYQRAATTGFQAANALLMQMGTAGHDLWTVPMAGRRPVGRAAAALSR